jgi:hypothetical protein
MHRGQDGEAVHDTAPGDQGCGRRLRSRCEIDAGVEADVAKLVAAAKASLSAGSTSRSRTPGSSATWAGIFEIRPRRVGMKTLRVNLLGPALMVKHAGKAMVDQGRGGAIRA